MLALERPDAAGKDRGERGGADGRLWVSGLNVALRAPLGDACGLPGRGSHRRTPEGRRGESAPPRGLRALAGLRGASKVGALPPRGSPRRPARRARGRVSQSGPWARDLGEDLWLAAEPGCGAPSTRTRWGAAAAPCFPRARVRMCGLQPTFTEHRGPRAQPGSRGLRGDQNGGRGRSFGARERHAEGGTEPGVPVARRRGDGRRGVPAAGDAARGPLCGGSVCAEAGISARPCRCPRVCAEMPSDDAPVSYYSHDIFPVHFAVASILAAQYCPAWARPRAVRFLLPAIIQLVYI